MSVRLLHKQEKIQTEIKIIAESIGFCFCFDCWLRFYNGTWNGNLNFASCNRLNANSNLAPFSIIILSLSDVCESTQGVCELAIGETTGDQCIYNHFSSLSLSVVLFFQLESLSIGDDHKLTEHEERDWNVSSSDIHTTEPTKEACRYWKNVIFLIALFFFLLWLATR